ncbi:MAG: hypothetical protein NZ518_05350 [Dehalococcoidia bacterium]|nr:hypothetical protein [Dehalococcoidia bacterium]
MDGEWYRRLPLGSPIGPRALRARTFHELPGGRWASEPVLISGTADTNGSAIVQIGDGVGPELARAEWPVPSYWTTQFWWALNSGEVASVAQPFIEAYVSFGSDRASVDARKILLGTATPVASPVYQAVFQAQFSDWIIAQWIRLSVRSVAFGPNTFAANTAFSASIVAFVAPFGSAASIRAELSDGLG